MLAILDAAGERADSRSFHHTRHSRIHLPATLGAVGERTDSRSFYHIQCSRRRVLASSGAVGELAVCRSGGRKGCIFDDSSTPKECAVILLR